VGGTSSSDFPTTNLNTVYDTTAVGLRDNFLSCLEIGKTNLTWSTYLGSDFNESMEYPVNVAQNNPLANTSIALTSQNVPHLVGTSNCPNSTFPVDDGGGFPVYFQSLNANGGISDGTITRFDAAMINAIVGLQDFKNTDFVFGLYPNPTASELLINNAALAGADLHYAIYDLGGKKLKEGVLKSADKKSIEVAGLPQGVYVLNVSDGQTTYSNKFVKAGN